MDTSDPKIVFDDKGNCNHCRLLMENRDRYWLPDERGRTLRLGCVFGREGAVLTRWREAVASCLARGQAVASPHPVISAAGR